MATNAARSPGRARRSAPSAEDFVDDLFRAHAVSLVRVAVLLLGDQRSAEDVVQDAFLRLYRGLPGLRDRDKALPYLRASVINGARSVLRARRRALLRRTRPGVRPGLGPSRPRPAGEGVPGRGEHSHRKDQALDVHGPGARAFHGTGDVSLSADGRVVAFVDQVLRTDAAPGSLNRRGRVVMHTGQFGASVTLGGLEVAPDGKTVYFSTFRVRHDKPSWRGWQLRAFDLATGQTTLVRSLPGTQGTPAAVAADPTGRFLMIEYTLRDGPTRLVRMDVATGRLTPLPARWVVDAAIAW